MRYAFKKILPRAALIVSLPAVASELRVDFIPQFDGAPLVFDAFTNRIASGQKISVTRLDFLLSDISLHRTDGIWLEQNNRFAFISARDGKTRLTLENVPPGYYDRLRFHIGLDPKINHGNVGQWPANHPLNPDVNHLYWGWSKEYIFLVLEGAWQNGREPSGFSYHLATDRMLMTVELPVALDLHASRAMQVALDVARIFSGAHRIELTDSTDTSHSRTNDSLAVLLRQNVENSFTIGTIGNLRPINEWARGTNHIEIAPNATPYRLTISAFAPQPTLPPDNPLTVEGVELGNRLFFDRRLSVNNSQSCATCHNPRCAFSQPQRVSRGANGEPGTRNAMSLENLAWKNSFFWDGRATPLREQVLQPIQNPVEMHESLTNLVARISADPIYRRLFTSAFGSPQITPDGIARALEQFMLTRVSFDSKFDQVMNGTAKFTRAETRGYLLFNTEYDPYHGQLGADCFHCHGGPLFQSQDFANNGLDSTFKDLGRYNVTKRDGDQGKFAVPSLRNVAVTGPYMHDGRFQTLEQVVEHYCTGMKRSTTLDPNLAKHPDGGVPLSEADKEALVAFLKTLTDERFLSPAAPTGLAQK
ncbi:MAG TPA: MbnP family protein [Candidatus Sulfopaludibacter sp.]|nr:MbnP family protein [Candidatus Sulfopaludibacter sp.]